MSQDITTKTRRKGNTGRNKRFLASKETFSLYMTKTVNSLGGPDIVGEQFGRPSRTISEYMSGDVIPYLRTLIMFAETFSLPVNDILIAAGKPPIEVLREIVISNHKVSLPGLLCSYRDTEHAGDTQRAADAVGITRWQFSKYANGSAPLRGMQSASRIARALELSIDNVFDAAGESSSKLRYKYESMASGFGGVVRLAVSECEIDPFDSKKYAETAELLGVNLNRLSTWYENTAIANVAECQSISAKTGMSFSKLLSATGMSAELSEYIEESLREKTEAASTLSLGELLKQYRKGAGFLQAQVAQVLGVASYHNIMLYETNRNRPSPRKLAAMAKMYQAPLGELLRVAKYAV